MSKNEAELNDATARIMDMMKMEEQQQSTIDE